MKKFKACHFVLAFIIVLETGMAHAQKAPSTKDTNSGIQPAAARMELYLPMLKGKSVAVFANQTSVVGNSHLVDTLLSKGVNIKKIFSPEHGFRGTADAGEKVGHGIDAKTGLPLVSLYGKKRKPSAEDLKDIDLLLFDIQDVGVRFYTYISSLEELMESVIEFKKPLVILDRPNPNGFYVDGPVLEKKFTSFIGMQPVPVVYGMTIGEYANMLIGEKWLEPAIMARLPLKDIKGLIRVIPNGGYTHKSKYVLPIKPSPNLPEIQSVYWFPSIGFIEGTVLSEGRGTEKPFQLFGHPSLPKNLKTFTPVSRVGATAPKLQDQLCYGWDLSGTPEEVLSQVDNRVQIKWLLEAYRLFPEKDKFFLENNFINKLAGNDVLQQQVRSGKTESEIRQSWQSKLAAFKKIRSKYLLYPDFE
jgi:uncharacterized protein YbbC (DUF1343 family)